MLSIQEMADENQEHLGVMAYAARFLNLAAGVSTYERAYKETRVMPVLMVTWVYVVTYSMVCLVIQYNHSKLPVI